MKRILLCTDGSAFAEHSYPYGAWFASRLGATVDVVYVSDDRGQTTAHNLSGSIGLGASEALLKQLVEVEHERAKLNRQKARLILQNAEQALTQQGVQAVNLIHKTGFLVDSLAPLEAEADVIVLGKRGEAAEFASGHLGANVDRIVRSSRKPCLVTPGQFTPIERLLVAYDGSKSCQKLLEFLVTSPVFQGLELHILTVAKKADDEDAIAHLKVAEMQAQAAGFSPICQVIPGNPEQVIANYVESYAINLLLMGAYGHSRIRHLVIGSTTIQLLRSSHIPVLLFR